MAIESINPATGQRVRSYEEMAPATVADIIGTTHEAYLAWRRTSFDDRARAMRQAAKLLRDRAGDYARTMALEMGKPLRDGIAEAQKCATACDFYAEHAARFLAREPIATEARSSFVTFNPLGVVLAVMPWNFPFWQVFRFAAPTLMAGNAAVLKHASNVPACALAIDALFRDAGFPQNLFRTLMIGTSQVDAVIAHPQVRAVTLTGSSAAGRAVARKAGEMLKKTVLELGGSDPYLVLEDADPDFAATVCAKGRLINAGQSCIAAKRFIVVDAIRREFEERFVQKMRAARMGDPLNEETQLGPLARHDLREQLHRQVEESLRKGARCLVGGAIPEGAGAFYPPTVLTEVAKGMPAYDEELFGPVAAVIAARDEAQAIAIANDSKYGLGGAVITRDVARGERIAAEQIESGCVFVNDSVRSDPRLPFGGVKDSGYGRELAAYGIKEFVNIKTVWVA
jgi:succinate-semialdehyde dehydrogenase / glutarate-semialdehyde dehydrogenase